MFNEEKNSTIIFSAQNLDFIKFFYNLLTFLCFFIQLILGSSLEDYYCIMLLLILNIIVSQYCFNEKILFSYPISTFVIFCTNIQMGGSSLYFKSLYLESVTLKLRVPFETFFFSLLCIVYLIICHCTYRNVNLFILTKNYLSNFLSKLKITNNTKFNNFIGCCCLALTFMITFFIIEEEQKTLIENINDGLKLFIIMPIINFFLLSINIYNTEEEKINFKYFIFIIFYTVSILFYSIIINSRGTLLHSVYVIIMLLIFFLLLGVVKITYKFFYKSLFAFILVLFISPIVNNYSQTLLDTRGLRGENINNPIKNFDNFLESFSVKKKMQFVEQETNLFREDYIPSTILGRVNTIFTIDNVFFVSKYLSLSSIEKIKDYENNQIISIIPEFIIRFFDKDFNKKFYIENTITAMIYKTIDNTYSGPKPVGSMFAILQIFYGYYFFIYFYLMVIICFIVMDSFCLKNQKFSYILFPLFYFITSIFVTSSMSSLIEILLRTIPQTIILYLLLYYIYSLFLKKN
jgi:hypothetical protein